MLGWHGLPERVFAWDYTQSANFGILQPGDHVDFTVTPPKNAKGDNAIVTKGACDQPGGFIWVGGPASWNGTVPPDFAAQHIGRFSGEYTYPGTNAGWALTWKMDTEAEVVKLETITDATIPVDRTRKKLGVGEKVTLTLEGATGSQVTWSLTGDGSIYPSSGSSTKFTAHERASGASVTAAYKGKTYTANFSVVEPSGIEMEREPGTTNWHINGTASAGFKGRAYITPNDVSFINIEMREQSCVGIGNGFYSDLNGAIHPIGDWGKVIAGTETKPNKDDFVDTVQSDSREPPFSYGTFTWPIPWEFRVGSGNAKVFKTVTHYQEADDTGKITISKGGFSVSKNADDPTSGY